MKPELVTLNLEQAASFLNMSKNALLEKVKSGQIPGAKPGKQWVFIEQDLVFYLRGLYHKNWQALQVKRHKEKSICQSTCETTSGGYDSPRQTENAYKNLLKQ